MSSIRPGATGYLRRAGGKWGNLLVMLAYINQTLIYLCIIGTPFDYNSPVFCLLHSTTTADSPDTQ